MDINDVLIFVRVAQSGSFSKAARLMNVPVSTVSRRVAQLEQDLGLSLLVRSTRYLRITEAGQAYLEHGKIIAAEIEKANVLATDLHAVPQGRLRLTATTDFGNRFLGPIVDEFLRKHAKVQVEVMLTERVVDLIDEDFDLAIRIGKLGDSSHLARKIGEIRMQLVASPRFLKIHGEPKRCADLAKFECIRFTGFKDPQRWRLESPHDETSVRVNGRIATNNVALVHEFALQGHGIALLPQYICVDDFKTGRLKPILKSWTHSSGPIHVVYPGQRFLMPKVRLFVDHLIQGCSAIPWGPRR